MRERRAKLSRRNDIAYMLKRWDEFTRFLDDSRICPDGVEKPLPSVHGNFFCFSFQAATIRSYACSTRAT